MCVTCGCGNSGGIMAGHSHPHEHTHGPGGTSHSHAPAGFARVPFRQPAHAPSGEFALSIPGRDTHTIELETQILAKNSVTAQRNRAWLSAQNILALNLLSSPGSGKTTLLERTLGDLKSTVPISVIEGDQATSNDADRIRATGVRALQINTGTGCHLEADMLERALRELAPEQASLLMIENVGNLVCPALFDLGERAKVVIFSVTEGEDKPLKYPHMFGAADLLILSKVDLLPHIRFDVELAIDNARSVNRGLRVLRVSAYSGEGLPLWYDWLKSQLAECSAAPRGGEKSTPYSITL